MSSDLVFAASPRSNVAGEKEYSRMRKHERMKKLYALLACVLFVCAATALAAQGRSEHPPVLELEYEMDLSVAGYSFQKHDLCFWAPSDRGYESLYATLTPADARKGHLLIAWDIGCGARKVVVADLNALVGHTPDGTAPGYRFASVVAENERSRSRRLIFAANGPTGARLIRYDMPQHAFKAVAAAPDGAEILRLSQHGGRPLVALLRKKAKGEYSLHTVESRKAENDEAVYSFANEIVAGGVELTHYYHSTGNTLFYRQADGTAIQMPAAKPAAAKAIALDANAMQLLSGKLRLLITGSQMLGPRYYHLSTRQYAVDSQANTIVALDWSRNRMPAFQGALDGAASFLPHEGPMTQLSCFGIMVRPINGIRRFLGEEKRKKFEEDVYAHVPWRDGALFKAVEGEDGKQHLLYFAPATGKLQDVGAMSTAAGVSLAKVNWLGSDLAGMVLALAEADGKLIAQAYRCPFLDSLRAVLAAARRVQFAEHKHSPIKLEVVDSYHAYGNEQDRAWDPFLTASDGNIYLGAMPHHPYKSTRVWRYVMGADRLHDYGAFDELAGLAGAKRIANMMHCFPIEMEGTIYFIGQDPFYGKRSFPTLPAETGYDGSTVLALDIKTQKITSMGVPVAGSSVHGILPAFTKGFLYIKEGYRTRSWYGFDLKSRKSRALNIPLVTKMQHVDPQGRMWMVDDAGQIQRFDPDKNETAVLGQLTVADFPDVKWLGYLVKRKRQPDSAPRLRVDFLPATLGKEKAIGFAAWCQAVVELDTATGAVRLIGRLRPDQKEYPPAITADPFRGFGVSGDTLVAICNMRYGKPRHTELHTLNLKTGAATYHGVLSDATGRLVQESNCMAVGSDGNIYLTATVFNNPRDRYYSHRFAWAGGQFFDTIFARLRISELTGQ